MKFLVSPEHPKGKIRIFEKFVIGDDGDEYLTRYIAFDSPWFGIFVHQIHRPDASPILHDHPWPFISFVLRGSYFEKTRDMSTAEIDDPFDGGMKLRHIRHFNYKSLYDAHFITKLFRYPTWTLVLVGPTKRVWGYWEMLSKSQRISVSLGGQTIMPGQWYRTEWNRHRNHGGYLSYEEQARYFRNHYADPDEFERQMGFWQQGQANWTPQERSRHELGYAHDPFAEDGES